VYGLCTVIRPHSPLPIPVPVVEQSVGSHQLCAAGQIAVTYDLWEALTFRHNLRTGSSIRCMALWENALALLLNTWSQCLSLPMVRDVLEATTSTATVHQFAATYPLTRLRRSCIASSLDVKSSKFLPFPRVWGSLKKEATVPAADCTYVFKEKLLNWKGDGARSSRYRRCSNPDLLMHLYRISCMLPQFLWSCLQMPAADGAAPQWRLSPQGASLHAKQFTSLNWVRTTRS